MKKLLLAVSVFLLFPTRAIGSPVTFGFTGTIIGGSDFFSGFYTFDDAPQPIPPGKTATYVFNGGPYGITFFFNSLIFSFPGVEISVTNDELTSQSTANPPISDRYGVVATGTLGGSGPSFINLRDCDGEALSSTALPLTPPDLSLFRPNCSIGDEVVFQGAGLIGRLATGTLTNLFLAHQPVPEPASLFLMAVCLIVMVRIARQLSRDDG